MIKLDTKKILILVLLLMFFISGFFVSNHFSKRKTDALKRELQVEKIKNDSIKKVAEGHFSKLVADTLTKKELRKKVKELEFKVNNPTEVAEIVLQFKQLETQTTATKQDSLIKIEDYYPNKKEAFISYFATINTNTYNTRGLFQINNLKLITAKETNEQGIQNFNIKVPEFVNVSSLNIQSEQQNITKKDNFGYLLGGQTVMDYEFNEIHAGVNFGIRYKKTYLMIGTTTNKTINTGLTFEF